MDGWMDGWMDGNHSNEPSLLALLSSSEPCLEYVFNNRRAAVD
jgi:hypothetical protein